MSVSLRDFYRMRPLARKTQTRVVIAVRCGLPFFLPGIRRRFGFTAGILLAAAILWAASLFVWDIDLDGNLRISDDQIYTFLEEQGVQVGMRISGLDIEKLEKELRKEFDLVTWTSAQLSGVRLRISVKENELAEPAEAEAEETAATSLISEYAGTVVSMIVRSGVPQVAIGDAVEEGTLLVDGLVPVYNEDQTVKSYQPVQADADIVLEHQRIFRAELPSDTVSKAYTGREEYGLLVRVGSHEWHLAPSSPYLYYDTVTTVTCPEIFRKLELPVFYGRISFREYQNTEREYPQEEAEKLLKEKLSIFLTDLEQKGVQIIEKDVKIEANDSEWLLEGVFLVQEKVGTSVAAEEGEPIADE